MGRRRTVWRFLAAGFTAATVLAVVPGLSPAGWPLRGPFGAFTWTAWYVCAGLAATLAAVAVTRRRPGRDRAALAASGFGLIAAAAYATAAGAGRIEHDPAPALATAVVAAAVVKAVAARLADTGGADVAG